MVKNKRKFQTFSSKSDHGSLQEVVADKRLACVASVSVEQRGKKKRGFQRFARAKNGARAKIRRRGWGRGRKEPLVPSFLSPTPSFGSFLPLPHPLLLIFALAPFFARAKRRKPRFFFALCSTETLATQANKRFQMYSDLTWKLLGRVVRKPVKVNPRLIKR